MLVLSRKLNESIQIGENVTLRIVQIKGNRVRLGIEAPSDVHIIRSELHTKTEAEHSAAEHASSIEAEPLVVVPPFAAEAASDVMPPELMGADADHWQSEMRPRPAARPRRVRMWMPDVVESMPAVATAK